MAEPDITEVDLPEPPRVSSFLGTEEDTYAMWVSLYGRAEADRRADRCGIPIEKRRLPAEFI